VKGVISIPLKISVKKITVYPWGRSGKDLSECPKAPYVEKLEEVVQEARKNSRFRGVYEERWQ